MIITTRTYIKNTAHCTDRPVVPVSLIQAYLTRTPLLCHPLLYFKVSFSVLSSATSLRRAFDFLLQELFPFGRNLSLCSQFVHPIPKSLFAILRRFAALRQEYPLSTTNLLHLSGILLLPFIDIDTPFCDY